MDATKFESPEWGRAIRTEPPGSFAAFIPEHVPRELGLSADTVMLLSEADAALGRLAGSGRLLPDPHLLVNAYITREAVSSSRIEGTQASVTEVFDAAVTGETKRDDIYGKSETTWPPSSMACIGCRTMASRYRSG